MGYSGIGVTMNTYMHLGLEDAKEEMIPHGGTERCESGTEQDHRREACDAEDVPGNLISKRNTEDALLTVVVGRAFCCGEILTDVVK